MRRRCPTRMATSTPPTWSLLSVRSPIGACAARATPRPQPSGRLVVGEGQPDPHMVPFDKLRMLADATGLTYEGRIGGRLGYFASFRAI